MSKMVVICYETPQGILEDEEVDIFELAIPAAEPPATDPAYRDLIIAQLWREYRYRGLSMICYTGIPGDDPSRDAWIQMFNDRYETLIQDYGPIILKWMSAVQNETITDDTDEIAMVVNSGQTEDLPDTPTLSNDEYLSTRYLNRIDTEHISAPLYERIKRMTANTDSPVRALVRQFKDFFIAFQ